MSTHLKIMLVPAVLLLLWQSPAWALVIGPLLDTCPQHDPVHSQIRSDFEIRRNGVPVQDIPCSEPISQLPISQYTDELIVVQGLRAVFYMLGTTPLPWAPRMSLYDWMKSKMAGVNISDTARNSSCCETLDGKRFFTLQAQNDSNRDFDRGWRGISGNIDLYAHELRHLDGFPHVSCCGIQGGCDQTYDETNLSPYGIQRWLNEHWLTGDLYVGFSCLAPTQIDEIANTHLFAANNLFRNRFCDARPPVLTRPATPGGRCGSPAGVLDLFILVDLSGSFADDLPLFKMEAPRLISDLKARNPNIRVGLGKFEDYPIPSFGSPSAGDKAYERLVDLTDDTDAVLRTIAALFTRDGGDLPQSQLAALFQAATGAGENVSVSGASIPSGQQATFRDGATKLILLWTDAKFHLPGDLGGNIPYPGPTFSETVQALLEVDPAKVIGISSGIDAIPDLEAIAEATGALAPADGIDCDGDGNIDIPGGKPLVCGTAPTGEPISQAILALVEAAAEPSVINSLVAFEPIASTFTTVPDSAGCPSGFGKFSFQSILTNISDSSLSNLVIEVAELTSGNLLLNADAGPGGVGARATVPRSGSLSDGNLGPSELVDMPFTICLGDGKGFTFFVDVLGLRGGVVEE